MNNGSSKNVADLKNIKYEFIVKNDPNILFKRIKYGPNDL